MENFKMFKKIIIASDLSEASEAVINCLKDFKSLGVEEVILFYAYGIKHLAPPVDYVEASVEPKLTKQKKFIEDQGFNVTLEIAPGVPSEELKQLSKQKEVSLIIIGTQGNSAATHPLFRIGGVTSQIIHSHEKPLLVVRTMVFEKYGSKTVETTCHSLKDRILFATDFSDISMRAFEYVKKLVEDGCKKVTLLHVQDKPRIEKHLIHRLEEFNKIDTERLEMRKKELLEIGAEDVEIKIPFGIPAKEILDEAKNSYSLIVMGSQGRGFFREFFIGSVSHKVVRGSDVSVMLIPSAER